MSINHPQQIQLNAINTKLQSQPRNPNNLKINSNQQISQLINQSIYNYDNPILNQNSQQVLNNFNSSRVPSLFTGQSIKQEFPQNIPNGFSNFQQYQKLQICPDYIRKGTNLVIYPVFSQNFPQIPPILNQMNNNGNEGINNINGINSINNINSSSYDNNGANGNKKM